MKTKSDQRKRKKTNDLHRAEGLNELFYIEMGLQRIYLKVRDWHQRGIVLYESLGFKKTGRSIVEIQGQPVNFVNMKIWKFA